MSCQPRWVDGSTIIGNVEESLQGYELKLWIAKDKTLTLYHTQIIRQGDGKEVVGDWPQLHLMDAVAYALMKLQKEIYRRNV